MLLLKNVPNICGREIRNFRVQDAESGMNSVSSKFAAMIKDQLPQGTKPPVFVHQLLQDT
jgi:hypothetical protein